MAKSPSKSAKKQEKTPFWADLARSALLSHNIICLLELQRSSKSHIIGEFLSEASVRMTLIKNHQNTYKSVTTKNPNIYLRSKSLKMAKMAILGLQGVISGLPGQKWLKRHMNLWWNSALKRHYFRTDAEGQKRVKKRGSKNDKKNDEKTPKIVHFSKNLKNTHFGHFRVFRGPQKGWHALVKVR
jgi:hypothetical protein